MEELINLDKALFLKINGTWTYPILDKLMPVLTDLHQHLWFIAGLVPLLVAIWVFKFKVRALKTLVLIVMAIALADAVSYRVVKPLVDRPRPEMSGIPVTMRTLPHSGKSFPSNHAANNFAAATILSFAHPPAAPLFFAVAFVIAYSRIYVGVHFPLDVLGGATLGVIISTLIWVFLGFKWLKNTKGRVVLPPDPLRRVKRRHHRGDET